MSTFTPPPGWGAAPAASSAPDNGAWFSPQAPVWIYAGFWWRVWAFLIDTVLLSVAEGVAGLFVGPEVSVRWQELPLDGQSTNVVDIAALTDSAQPYDRLLHGVSVLVPHIQTGNWQTSGSVLLALLPALYFILFESSRMEATPGKRLCRLRVVTLSGERISLLRATVRFAIKAFISFPFLYIGVLMVAFTRRKQGLHDLIAGTLVVRHDEPRTVSFNP
jgi:uncharacterized RDD family membrane protein YckC